MEKYSNKTSSRSSRNKSLYNNIYTYDSYSNIEGIADIEKNNQVDITKVRELLESRDRYQNKESIVGLVIIKNQKLSLLRLASFLS